MALAANAIVSLADVKAYLRITTTDNDSLLETLIDTASTRIESYCDRKIIEQTFRESYNANGQRTLRLRNYPVSSITRLATGNKLAFTVSSTVSTDVRATVEVQDDRVLLDRYTSDGTHSHTNINFANHGTASAIVTHINTVAGFSATLGTNCLAEDLYRAGGVNVISSAANFYFPDQDDTAFRLHEDRATLEFTDQSDYAFFGRGNDRGPRMPVTFAGIVVEYKAGFEDIAAVPEDLKQAARMLVQYLFEVGAQDPTLASETIGAYSYSRSTDQLIDEAGIAKLLAPYMDRKS